MQKIESLSKTFEQSKDDAGSRRKESGRNADDFEEALIPEVRGFGKEIVKT